MSEEWVSGKVNLKLAGEPVEFELSVPAQPVKVRRVLPVFQAIADSFTEIGEAAASNQGQEISCKKGCGACCRQTVPLMEVETYHIRDIVENLPEPRRTQVKERFDAAVDRLVDKNWFERMKQYDEMTYDERVAIIMEYFYEGIACPFLEDESCSIYQDRPLVCREYLVISPAENCQNPTKENIRPLKIPAKVSYSVRQFDRYERFVPLISALQFAEQIDEDDKVKVGPEWMKDFFKDLTNRDVPEPDVLNVLP